MRARASLGGLKGDSPKGGRTAILGCALLSILFLRSLGLALGTGGLGACCATGEAQGCKAEGRVQVKYYENTCERCQGLLAS